MKVVGLLSLTFLLASCNGGGGSGPNKDNKVVNEQKNEVSQICKSAKDRVLDYNSQSDKITQTLDIAFVDRRETVVHFPSELQYVDYSYNEDCGLSFSETIVFRKSSYYYLEREDGSTRMGGRTGEEGEVLIKKVNMSLSGIGTIISEYVISEYADEDLSAFRSQSNIINYKNLTDDELGALTSAHATRDLPYSLLEKIRNREHAHKPVRVASGMVELKEGNSYLVTQIDPKEIRIYKITATQVNFDESKASIEWKQLLTENFISSKLVQFTEREIRDEDRTGTLLLNKEVLGNKKNILDAITLSASTFYNHPRLIYMHEDDNLKVAPGRRYKSDSDANYIVDITKDFYNLESIKSDDLKNYTNIKSKSVKLYQDGIYMSVSMNSYKRAVNVFQVVKLKPGRGVELKFKKISLSRSKLVY